MQRRILAALAILMLLSAVVLWMWWPGEELPLACCWRGGAILAAAWLAYDDVQRLPNWILLMLPLLLIVLVRFPRYFLMLIPVLIAWAVLRRILGPAKAKGRD
jgi:hypothetical protein